MATAFIRTIVLYFLIMVGLRLLGKRQIGELEPIELVLTLLISDLAAVPMLHELSHLPVIVDPSHATGINRLVPPMALAATAGGADGLIIEVHNDPMHALCDGAQSLRPEVYDDLAKKVRSVREVIAK